jgi:hypothetical protein
MNTLKRRYEVQVLVFLMFVGFCGKRLQAATWLPFGPDGGDARAFAADPHDPSHLYLGTANGWMYESRLGGAEWHRLAKVGKRDDLILDSIVVDVSDVKHIVVGAWVAGSPSGGLYVSRDGGATWVSNPEMKGQHVMALTGSASDPRTLVAGTLKGVYRSEDGGDHWHLISPEDSQEIHEVESIAIDPADARIIYAGTWHLPWKTTDGGQHWHSIKQGIIDDSDVFSIILDPKDPKTVYASACSGIYKSDDAGGKFLKVQGIPSTARRTRVLMQDPQHLDTVFAGTTEGLWRSDDAGKTWVRTTGPEIIVNDVYVDPADHTHVLLATDRGGVMASHDRGTSFEPSSQGFSARQITSWVADTKRPAFVYAGVVNDKLWGGVFASENGGLSWYQKSAGLNGRDVFSLAQASDGTIVAGTGHGIFRLMDGIWAQVANVDLSAKASQHAAAEPRKTESSGKNVHTASRAVSPAKKVERPQGTTFDGSVVAMAREGDVLYAVTNQGLLKSGTAGESWQRMAGVEAADLQFISVSRSTILVSGLRYAEISVDSGKSWAPVSMPPQLTQIGAAAVDEFGAVWIGGREGVFISTDRGATWGTLKDVFLRDVNSVYYDEASQRMLLTANGTGTLALSVHLPDRSVKVWETGWNLRFIRPVGDHMIGATLFDGIVVQPRMVDSSEMSKR